MIDSDQLQYFNGKTVQLLNSEQNVSDRYNEYSMNRSADYMPYDDSYYEEMYCMNVDANNMSYLNISCETNLSYSVPLYGYFAPFLLFTTVTVSIKNPCSGSWSRKKTLHFGIKVLRVVPSINIDIMSEKLSGSYQF